jgi:hypothetical protein
MCVITLSLISSRFSSARFHLSVETSTLYVGAAITQNSISASLNFCDLLASMNASLIHLNAVGFHAANFSVILTFNILIFFVLLQLGQ